eukprot:3119741-Rhodomonas_salina.1
MRRLLSEKGNHLQAKLWWKVCSESSVKNMCQELRVKGMEAQEFFDQGCPLLAACQLPSGSSQGVGTRKELQLPGTERYCQYKTFRKNCMLEQQPIFLWYTFSTTVAGTLQ